MAVCRKKALIPPKKYSIWPFAKKKSINKGQSGQYDIIPTEESEEIEESEISLVTSLSSLEKKFNMAVCGKKTLIPPKKIQYRRLQKKKSINKGQSGQYDIIPTEESKES